MNLSDGYWKLVIVSVRKWSLDVKNKVWDFNNRRGLKYEIWLLLEARNWVTDGSWLQTFHWLLKGGRTTTSTSMWTMPSTTPYSTLPSIFTSSGGYHFKNSDMIGNTSSTEELGWIRNQRSHLGASWWPTAARSPHLLPTLMSTWRVLLSRVWVTPV